MSMQTLSIKTGKPKKVLGIILIILGLAALVTPFTPGSWLAFIGLELLGIRIVAQEKTEELLARAQRFFERFIK